MSQPTRYRATIAYVGTSFHGWQRQKNAPRTVQAVLEDALRDLARAPVRVEGASRTDAGVHADGQVAHFDLPRRRDPKAVRDAINGKLPEDVRVLAVEEAAPEFHARFDAGWKEYLYRWSRAEVIAPRDRPFVARISPRADVERLREAARVVPGERDFRIFAVTAPSDRSPPCATSTRSPSGKTARSSRPSSAGTASCAAWCARSAACCPTWRGAASRRTGWPACSKRATGGCFLTRRPRTD